VRYEDSRALLDYGWDLLSMRNETTSYAVGDFNGDGYDDLAVGMPQAGAGGASGAGKVALLAGTATGIRTTAPRTINQGLGSIPGSPESGDGFGHAVAVGDFDGDGYDDLAVGSPWEDIHGELNAGNVTILYGSGSGLSTSRVQGWNQGSSGVPGIGEGYDAFGQSLAAGDFDGDGYDDLAIGIPGEDIEDRAAVDAGGVVILRGSPLGMTSSGAVYLHQSEPSAVPGEAETGDAFGFSLVAGHFDSDRYEDLAIGVPGEDVDDDEDAGMVCVIHGTSRGLDPDFRVASVTDDEFGASSAGEAGDLLGHALAAGDFNGDGIDDLAAGAPGEDFDSIVDAGAVLVAYGASSGLTTSGAQFFYEGTGSMGTMETRDAFGAALAAADFDGDGKAELAVGIPGEDETMANLGAAVVIRGTSSGLSTSAGTTRLGSNTTGNEGQFGSSLAAGRFDGDGIADLAVAMPAYSASGAWTRGATRVFDGESSGLSAAPERTWSGL
jgi:hypothetical protein